MIRLTGERRRQLDFIGITDEDLAQLKTMEPYFSEIADQVVDELYDHILKHPELRQIIEEHSTLERLKETQRWYYMSLVSGEIDEEFIEKRLFIGKVHSKIGLTPDWYLGTYMVYYNISVKYLQKVIPDQWITICHQLTKLFNFDSQLVLEAYEADEKAKVLHLANQKEHLLQKVSSAVQELASMMVELNENSRNVASTANETSRLQEKSHHTIEELSNELKSIEQMGNLMGEIADQTHLLGLNAAIEAARAGEAGRGFGVVAGEIRKLSAHSHQSLDKIKEKLTQITKVLSEVRNGSEQTAVYAKNQVASSEQLASFVTMLEQMVADLESMQMEMKED